ncbi:MAG: hypothetical protein P4L74_02535 [Candidatus Doudnabacteria bacterium]|nr:hypothetical protein [Candidatus Doudnabacteria bacterium]
MQKHSSKAQSSKGFKQPDYFLNFVKGYSQLERVAGDVNFGCRSEIEGITESLFPSRARPVDDRPGYVTYEHDYFTIKTEVAGLPDILNRHFFSGLVARDNLFSFGYNIAGYLAWACREVLTLNKCFCGVDWGEVELKGKKLILPVYFNFLPTETMKRVSGIGGSVTYQQKYSWLTYLTNNRFRDWEGQLKPRKYEFDRDEVLYYENPLSKRSPVQKTLGYYPSIKKFWMFGIKQGKGSNEPTERYLPIEFTRYTNYKKEKRKHDIIKGEIGYAFKSLLSQDVAVTTYYDVYTVIRYKKTLNDWRKYLVDQFNKQVLETLRAKNNFDHEIKLEYSGFLPNEGWDKIFADYTAGRIGWDVLLKELKQP